MNDRGGVRRVLPWIVPVLILTAWEYVTRAGRLSVRVLPEPWAVIKAAWHLTQTGKLLSNLKVSSGRAFAPLGAPDALTRIEMHALSERLWLENGFTTMLVTHHVQEAAALADRVVVIDDGTIVFDATIDLPWPRVRGSRESQDLAFHSLSEPQPAQPRSLGGKDALQLRKVSKTFDLPHERLQVLDEVSLDVAPGEFVCIVGASGYGKSTLLRLIAGLDTEYTGSIAYEGRPITGPDLSRGSVFQEHRLFRWLTVEQNIQLAFGATSIPRQEQRERVREQIHRVSLSGFETAWPHQISGGMAQRAAIARALVNRPRLLLLDVPLGALDALTRLKLQQEPQRLWLDVGITMIIVTHDIEEAVFLADRIVAMTSHPGRINRVVAVPLPHPRERTELPFNAIKHDVLGVFTEESS